MKRQWEYKKLPEYITIQYGFPFESNLFSDDTSYMPLIRIRDVKRGYTETFYKGDYAPEYIIHQGDFLIGMDGEFNIAAWQSGDALLNQRVCKISASNKQSLIKFFYYFLKDELKRIEHRTPFVTVKHLSAKQLNAIKLPVPPLSIQEQIVAELDKINEVIADNRELLKKLDALEQALFYDTFGDPVTNPKGWKVKQIETICDKIVRGPFGGSLKKEIFVKKTSDSFKVYEQKHAIKKDASIGEYYISLNDYERLKRFCITPGDIIMSCSGTIGEFYQLPSDCEPGVINQALLKFTLNACVVPTYFLFLMRDVKTLFTVYGVGLQNIGTVSTIKCIQIPLPPLSLQQRFAQQIEAIEQQKAHVEENIQKMQTLLDSRMAYWFQ